ncbi:alpha/beta fold hydrolase [Flavimarina sp. Hel_I_48]|uniref:alpha/beta fold hydrolase n=1 Tax=Flavimarina sp. Hel_I_48 TaxID=1392488 RepID=UPI0004DF128A|nr:alpha/beta hydrolase [Flavimarina sp. Hel_I_48]
MITPVYLMPGMAASPEIFESWKFPEQYKIYLLRWEIPKTGETIVQYAQRMTEHIAHENPVLIGVSFGGVIVQEMAKLIPVKKLIIISSVKTKFELPRRMRLSRKFKLYNIIPVSLAKSMKSWSKYAPNKKIEYRLELYKKYLSVDDPHYLKWAIRELLCWEQNDAPEGIVHIHGDADPVFPHKYIGECVTIPSGTHIMVITKWKWFNENIPRIIENNQ